jgi:hypothetical protein
MAPPAVPAMRIEALLGFGAQTLNPVFPYLFLQHASFRYRLMPGKVSYHQMLHFYVVHLYYLHFKPSTWSVVWIAEDYRVRLLCVDYALAHGNTGLFREGVHDWE